MADIKKILTSMNDGLGEAKLVQTYSTSSSNDGYTYTYSTQIGTAGYKRKLIIAAGYRSSNGISVTACTVNGLSATRVVHDLYAADGCTACAIFCIDFDNTDTSANIVISTSGGFAIDSGMTMWNVEGLSSIIPKNVKSVLNADPHNLSLPAYKGGFIAGFVYDNGASGGSTWTGLIESSDNWKSTSAYIIPEQDEPSRYISANISQLAYSVGVAASWSKD